jgi:hypothetical protein
MKGRGVRKAYASRGDDVTLSRFVKIPMDEREALRKRKQWRLPGFDPARKNRTLFPKSVVEPMSKNALVSGHSNVKIGRDVRKGKLFRGYWIYTLTLEERATCPTSCQHWTNCYGNNMPWAKRLRHGPALENSIELELNRLCNPPQHTRGRQALRKGVLVRLHALGDFYSADYVWFWRRMLKAFPNLAVYGYTARKREGDIGKAILRLKREFGRRFAIRWSNGGTGKDCTVSVKDASQAPATSFVCPEQTGSTAACATCGLCWNTDRNVAFIEH